MLLRNVRVEGFKCFAAPVEVAGLSEGLNLLCAPNGSGKSTLFEAVRHALLDQYSVSGKQAELMRPWGRSVDPAITVDFVHDGVEWRLFKRFLDAPECVLWRREEAQWVVVARSEKADERVRTLLERPAASRGIARETHWGLAQILWAPQGAMTLAPLELSLAVRMRQSLTAQLVGTQGAALERAVSERYSLLYTPTTGKLRTGKRAAELVLVEQEQRRLTAEIESAKSAYERWQESSKRVDSLRQMLSDARAYERRMSAECEGLLDAQRERQAKDRALLEAESRAQQAASELRVCKGVLSTWTQTLSAIEQSKKALEALSTPSEQLQTSLHRAIQDEAAAAEQLREREKIEQQWVDAERQQLQSQLLAQEQARLRTIDEQLLKLHKLEERVVAAKSQLEQRASVSAEQLSRVVRAHTAIAHAEATLQAASVTLSVQAQRDQRLQYDDIECELTAGDQRTWTAATAQTLVIDGVATITAQRAQSSDTVDAALAQKSKSEQLLAECVRRFGTHAPEALDAMRIAYDLANAEYLQAKQQRDELLSVVKSVSSLQQARGEQRERVAALELSVGQRPQDAHDGTLLKVLREQLGSVREMQQNKDRSMRERAKIESRIAADQEREAQERHRLEQAEERLRLLKLESSAPDLNALKSAVEDAMLAAEGARLVADRLRVELSTLTPIATELARAQSEHRAATEQVQTLRDELRTEEGRLEEQSRGASYARLARAEEQLATTVATQDRLKLEADAIRLLHDTLKQCREDAVSSVVGDVEVYAARILSQITGEISSHALRVVLGQSFEPLGAKVGAYSEAVGLDALSGGEHEQVHFAVRLALAEVLAKEQRVMLVFDDVMVATDQARMDRVIKLLEDAAERMQIVVLTCHPERYAHAVSARRIELARPGAKSAGD